MERAFTKITSLILVMMVLMSSLSTTIVYAADEIKGTDEEIVQNTDSLDETSDGNQEDENVPEDADKEDSEPLVDEDSENVGEESVAGEEEHEDEPILEPDDQRPRLMSSPRNTANTQSNENQGEEEENSLTDKDVSLEIKPTTKHDIESLRASNKFKSRNDDYEIRIFGSNFISGASKDENDNLVWNTNNQSSGHEFTFRVNYATSGLKELSAGSLRITIPKKILRDRAGNLADEFTMSLPTLEEFNAENGTTEFVYKELDDYIVVYNPKEIPAAVNGYFEIAYSTSEQTLYYKDYDSANTGLVKDGGTASDPFYAILSLDTGDEILSSMTDDTNVFINTTAQITSTQKRYPTLYRSWNPQWMAETPADSDDYYYLVWEIQSYIGTPTQMYNFSLEDVIEDLTDGTSGEDYEFVGYKLSGEKYYSQKNTAQNQTISGHRYDYVLTRHKKSTYSPIAYKLKNTVTATVDPIDQVDDDTKQTSSNTFSWNPSFVPPTGSFYNYKYGNNNWINRFGHHWDYASYDLDKLQNYQETGVTELKGFKYYTETIGYSYPWTLKDGGSLDNPDDYGYKTVSYDTWDDTLYLEDDEEPMSTSDYYLEYFTYNVSMSDAKYDEFYQKFDTIPVEFDDDEIITFYTKFNGEDNWIEIGSLNLKTKALTSNTDYVSEMTSSKVTFKEGVHATGWRFTTTNKHYSTVIAVTPYFVLTNSEHVQEKIQNKDKIQIKNFVNMIVKDNENNIIFNHASSAIDYARVTYYSSDITKNIASVSNSRSKRVYTITWKVNAWEKATAGTGEAEYVWQDSGIFYDLIPLGGTIDLDSIQIQTQDGFLAKNSYSYEVIDNYKNSGRSMLIVRVKDQAQYYNVYYSTLHTWDSMKDYGRNVLNPVAYETGNEKITNGYPDDGGELSLLNKVLYTDLDESTDEKKFIYAEQNHVINALTAAASGLDKKVKSEKSSSYVYSTEVEPDGRYSYKLRYQNTYMNKAKNLIWYDSLENFEVIDSSAQTSVTSSWHGTLQSIDITQLKNKGIDVKVYISTIENLDLESNNDLTDTSVWHLVDEGANLERAKAIAIDITKQANGEDFVLDSGDSVTAILHMKAPSEISEEMEENPYTYNNVYIKNTIIDSMDSSEDYFIHQDYTKVKYHVIADVPFRKVNEQDETEGIKDITFRLYGTSRYGTEVDTYATSDKDGYVLFKDIEAGTYTLQEYEGLIDWVEDHTEHEVRIDIDRKVYIDNQLVTAPDTIKITNTPRIHTDVKMYKKDLVSKVKVVEGAKFKLEGTSDYGNEIVMYATSKEDGELLFDNLEKGKYELTEIEVPEGYVLGEEKYQVIVDENANYNVLLKNEDELIPTYENGKYNLYNEPLHGFTIVKKDSYDGSLIVGAKFRVHGVSNYGTSYDKEVTSVSGGLAMFDELEAGTYILEETFVPEITDDEGNTITYILDENKYIVTIAKDGTTTIEGLEKNQYGNFEFFNDRNKGQITITKEWEDDITNEERPDPTIKVSTKKPHRITYVYFRDKYYGSYTPLYYLTNNFTYGDKITGEFKRNTTLTEEEVVALGATRLDKDYNNSDAKYKIYGWIDENGNCYWWSNAEVALITDRSNRFFYNLTNVISIDTTGLDTSYVTDMNNMFSGCKKLTSLDLSNFDTSNVTNMSYMFYECKKLTSLDLGNFDTGNVTNMGGMFFRCSSLTSLDLSNFDTSNVTNMASMFFECSGLTSLNVSNFDTGNVTNMGDMFNECSGLTSLDVSNFDTGNVTSMSGMFWECTGLTNLDVSNFDTSNVTNMYYMFSRCRSLTSLDVSNFNTSKVTNMDSMFDYCRELTSLDVSNFNTSKVTNMNSMFNGCSGLTSLDVSNFDTSNVTSMRKTFSGCSGLTSLDLSNFDTSNVTNMQEMFYGCRGLTNLDVSNFDTSNVTNMSGTFYACSGLTSLDVSNFDTSNVTNMASMFYECSGLTSLDVSNFDTSNVTNMNGMFMRCSSLTSLDVSNFDTRNVTNMQQMFVICSALTTIYASSNFVTTNVNNSLYMFSSCTSLVGGNGTAYNSSYTDKTYARIDTPETPGYFTEKNPQSGAIDDSIMVSRTDYLQTKHMMAGNTADGEITYSTSDTNYDDQGNEIHWVKEGNVWTYTLYVEDPNAEWYAWEEPVPAGYISNYTIDNPGEVENQQIKIVNILSKDPSGGSSGSSDDEDITVKYGNLSVTKELKDHEGNVLSKDDDGTEFTVTVRLTAPTGYENLYSGTKVFGDYVFKDGVSTIKLYAGDTITIPGLIEGTTYSVVEKDLGPYESSCDSNSGSISTELDSGVIYINVKKQTKPSDPGDPDEPSQKYVDVRLDKVVTGAFEDDNEYTFEVTLSNLLSNQIYVIEKYSRDNTVIEEINYVSDDNGSVNVQIKLKNGEHIVLKDLPVGSRYKVFEYAGDYTSSYEIVDSNNKNKISSTANLNTKENKSLSTATEVADEDENITITFTNRKSAVQNLKLVKQVTNSDDTNSYIFEIEFSNMPEGTSFNSSVGKVTADQDGVAELTVYLAGGEEVEFYNIPVGTKYQVTELASTAIASYVIVDSNGMNKIDSASGANTNPKTALSTELETVNQGEEATITFINDTVNVDEDEVQDNVSVSIGIINEVVNEENEVLDDCEEIFKFELIPMNEENPMPDNTEVAVTGNGVESFGTITFTEIGTYTYTVVEKSGDSDEYIYDDTVYTVIFEVTKPEGLLEVRKTVMKNGFMGDVIKFTNVLKSKPEEDDRDKDDEDDTIDNEDNNESSSDESNQENNSNRNESASTKTGDIIWIYIADIAISGIILVVSIRSKKRRR